MPEAAPNQVAYFIKTAQAGGYDGTTFHAMFKNGMVQGGDPLSKDPAKRSEYGTGGQNAVKAEPRAASITSGSVAAVLVPGQPDSAGAQFYVFLADQPALANQLTVFGKVADGMEVLQKISEAPLDATRHAVDRIEITRVTIRDTPPEPFVNETAQQLSAHRAVLDTSAGTHHDRVAGGQGSGNRPAVSPAGGRRGVQRDGVPPGRAGVRHSDRRAVEPPGAAFHPPAEPCAQPSARIQRYEAREGHCLDGPRRRPRQRDDVVFHLHRSVTRD